jgi:hypothetical protein
MAYHLVKGHHGKGSVTLWTKFLTLILLDLNLSKFLKLVRVPLKKSKVKV